MKRKLQISFNSRIKYVLAFCALLLLNTSLNYAQTTIVSDDFNRATLSPGGTPSLTYTSVLTGIATSYNVLGGLVANKATLAVETDGLTLG